MHKKAFSGSAVSILAAALCSFTFCFYVPMVSYLANQSLFPFSAGALGQAMLLPFLCILAALYVLFFVTNRISRPDSLFESEKAPRLVSRMHILVIAIVFCIWLEGFLLNKALPQLTGEKDIFSSVPNLVIDTAVWILVIALAMKFWRAIAKYAIILVIFLGVMLSLGIADASATTREEPKSETAVTSAEVLDGAAFHSSDNVFVLVLDAMSTALVQDYLEANPQAREELQGFTFFENNMQAAQSTQWSLPSILRGDMYAGGPVLDYQDKAFDLPDALPQRFYSQDYKVYASSLLPMFNHILDGNNSPAPVAESSIKMTSKLYGQLFLRFSPYVLKNPIANSVGYDTVYIQGGTGDGNMQHVTNTENMTYDEIFYAAITHAIEEKSSASPTFQFHHVNGSHKPYTKDRDGNALPDSERYSLNGLTQQNLWTMDHVMQLLRAMKESGIYDSSTIVLLGDHGDRLYDDTRENNEYSTFASLLIKPANSAEPFSISQAPTSNLYLAGLLPAIHLESKNIEDETQNLPQERELFDPNKSTIEVFLGEDVTQLQRVNSHTVEQTFTPNALAGKTEYSLSMLTDNANVAYPLEFVSADFSNGWGLKSTAEKMDVTFLLDESYKSQTVNVTFTMETSIPGGGHQSFDPYSVTIRNAAAGTEETYTISEPIQNLLLNGVEADENATVQFEFIFEPFTDQLQHFLNSIYFE